MKKLYIFLLLLPLCGAGSFGLPGFAQQPASVTVQLLSVNYEEGEVTFSVDWTGTPFHTNKVWVWLSYSGGIEPATVTAATATTGNVETTGFLPGCGFFVTANPSTVTATLQVPTPGKFSVCVYGSGYPPNAILKDDGSGNYRLRGTKPFTVNGAPVDAADPRAENWPPDQIIVSITDPTGYAGFACMPGRIDNTIQCDDPMVSGIIEEEKTVWVNEPFTISSKVGAAPGTYRWTRDDVVINASNTKDLTTSESTEGTYRYVRQIQTAGSSEWVSSNTCVVSVVSDLPPDTGVQTWTFSGLTWTMSNQTWSDPNWKQTWSGASSYVPAGCELNNNFAASAPPRYSTSDLQAGSGYLYNYVCVIKEQHNLCPAPWRVPTQQDFINLDRYFGGTGENRSGEAYQTFITTNYVNAWGGVYGGNGDGTSVTGKDVHMHYYSTTGAWGSAYRMYVSLTAVYPQAYNDQRFGFQVRCVR
jgi:uncharacterized protein (TIGR02145 family)